MNATWSKHGDVPAPCEREGKGKCWSGKHRTLETMHMEGEQNPEDYIRVKPTPTNQNISPGDGMQRSNV